MSGADEQAPTVDVPSFFYHLTRNSQGGTIYLKAVNAVGTRQPLRMQIGGASAVEPTGEAVEMKGEGTEDTNSISEPTKIVPVAQKTDGLGRDFTRSFLPYSITVLRLKAK